MQISKETVEILKNFAAINNSALFKKGTVQKTISQQKTILAQSTFKESFPRDFAIYDLSQFISVLSLFENPMVDFGEKSLTIKDGPTQSAQNTQNSSHVSKAKTTYYYAAPETITTPSEKSVVLPSVDAEFKLESAAFMAALAAAGILGLSEIYVSGRDGQTYIGATDSRSLTSNQFEYTVGKADTNFYMIFKMENLKVIPKNYTVKLCNKGLAHFAADTKDVEYWIPVSANKK